MFYCTHGNLSGTAVDNYRSTCRDIYVMYHYVTVCNNYATMDTTLIYISNNAECNMHTDSLTDPAQCSHSQATPASVLKLS